MEVYLQECKPNLKNAGESSRVQVVLGNESLDLDSAVSSIVFAYFLYKIVQSSSIGVCQRMREKSSDVIIPVLNVNRQDLPIHTEVVFFLDNTSIPLDQLICIDEIDLKSLQDHGSLDLVLVDHNVLSDQLSYLEPSIRQIVDHHEIRDPEITQKYVTDIEKVGSCSTLVAEHIFNSNVSMSVMDPQVAMLLYGTILTDTSNLSEKAKRATEKDKEIVFRLESVLTGVSRDEVFNTISKAKSNVTNLTPEQLLRKDTKYISGNSMLIGMASIPSLLQERIQEQSFQEALSEFSAEKKLTSVVLMGMVVDNELGIKRQIAIYDTSPESLGKISNYLLKLTDPSLQLQPLPIDYKSINLFDQKNSTLSRKFVLPALQEFLKGNQSGIKN